MIPKSSMITLHIYVIPAQAGTHNLLILLDSRFRGNDISKRQKSI